MLLHVADCAEATTNGSRREQPDFSVKIHGDPKAIIDPNQQCLVPDTLAARSPVLLIWINMADTACVTVQRGGEVRRKE
jgi:hypothetical protein